MPDLLTRVEQAVAAAEQEALAIAGGEAGCQLQRDGRVTGGVKYSEGKLAALMALRRQLRAAEPAAWTQLLMAELVRWQEALTHIRRQPQPSLPWLAYRQGGVDALAALRDDG